MSMNRPNHEFDACFDKLNAPALDRRKRANRKALADLREHYDPLFASRLNGAKKNALTALVYMWHDHWDEAHALAQAHEGDPDCDLVHALLHRREGDSGNSRYWFGEVGEHPVYSDIAADVGPVLSGSSWEHKLLKGGRWQPAAFVIAVCSHPQDPVLVRAQAAEMLAIACAWWPPSQD